ncbi:MAG: universal stress protein [Candidatus Abyssobacteria bacterium SURF_17]|jgi:nucleotide-binding universal stress UspA family protein|uniref:Universal stress protein n=1 Tax=Candidatus Abyssobacteria bacterium SURF_17 TaxID=2093361 RepID=A0A419EVP7_9BACT|nr:MAG: universal stress protein [Candidatus Abyssubacteria bacterium SURF_17]
MINIERILFPTDFSEHSKHAFHYALSFAKEYNAKLYMLHVIEDIQYLANAYMFDVPIMPSFADMEQNRLKEMQEFIDREVTDATLKIEKVVRRGRPFIEIIQMARDEKIDLIVIATHGRGGLEHVVFGSVAEKVVRKAPCPVLSIRMPGHEFTMP